jgi:UPF0755 protein
MHEGTEAAAAAPPRRPGRGLVAVAAAVALLAGGAALSHRLLTGPSGSASGSPLVRIAPGSDLRQIAAALAAAGVVDHPRLFTWAARLRGLERRLRAGDYRLDPRWSLPTLLTALVEGRGLTATVTIPEGWRLEQVAERLAAAGVAGRAEFLAAARDRSLLRELAIPGPSAEGFLFPETYPLPQPCPPAEVVRAMHRRFRAVWADLLAEGGAAQQPDLLATVTLASIVERETAAPEERPLVAAVFLNRLRVGMPLQADPTVIYGTGSFEGAITRRDLESPTPYNTYVIRGLPPGPIAAPGRDSLRAVLHPAPADYLYFVSRNDGTHSFSRTLAEHNRAVARFQTPGRRT